MKLILAVTAALLTAAPALAATYVWTDDSGTTNFTDDYSQVPKKYRKKTVTKVDADSVSSPADTEGVASSEEKTVPPVAPKATEAPKPAAPAKIYDGKSLDVWNKELTTTEEEVKALYAKVTSIGAQMKNPGENAEGLSRNELIRRYNSAVTEYNQANDRYKDKIEAARKAGVPL